MLIAGEGRLDRDIQESAVGKIDDSIASLCGRLSHAGGAVKCSTLSDLAIAVCVQHSSAAAKEIEAERQRQWMEAKYSIEEQEGLESKLLFKLHSSGR
jgi:hypothetical protein